MIAHWNGCLLSQPNYVVSPIGLMHFLRMTWFIVFKSILSRYLNIYADARMRPPLRDCFWGINYPTLPRRSIRCRTCSSKTSHRFQIVSSITEMCLCGDLHISTEVLYKSKKVIRGSLSSSFPVALYAKLLGRLRWFAIAYRFRGCSALYQNIACCLRFDWEA